MNLELIKDQPVGTYLICSIGIVWYKEDAESWTRASDGGRTDDQGIYGVADYFSLMDFAWSFS